MQSQIEIIAQAIGYKAGEKNRGKRIEFLNYFNEAMGPFAISRQSFCKWGKGKSKPDSRILAYAMQVYPEGDPRHEFAAALKEQEG